MPVTYIDIESRSACDLKKCGQYVYAAHPTTEITIVAWAVDGGPVSIWLPPRYNWNPAPSVIQHEGYTVHVGGAIPADLLASLDHDPMAHNASFERIMLSGPPGRRLGFPADLQRVARWDCTAARGAAVGLPRTLAGACGALGLAVQKDKDGHALMLKMCKPRKPRKAEVAANELLGGPMPLLWVDDFASMLREAVYCARDVEAERAIDRVIPRLRPEERETWECTEEANDHGAPVDVALLGAMLRVIDGAEERINGQISTRTGGVVPKVSDHGALTKWLVAQGIDDAKESGVGKQAIAAMIENEAEDSLVREVLAMRRDGGGVSPKKWRAILSRLSDDGRLRGSLVYGGAASTLRWSSRGAQLHNLPRGGSVKNVDAAVRDVVAGVDLDTIAERHGPPLVVASELLRPAFCAPDGFWVARGDYSQIEARVNPWLAGATWKLDAFRRYDDGTGPDLYKVSASGIYRVAVADVTKDQRQIGKVCLGASTKVLTQRGYVPIVSVTDTDLLWDGESWIKHSGLIFQGVKEVINWLGVTITPDHQLLSGDAWITARTASLCENTTRLVLERGSANLPLLATEPALKAVFLLCGSAVRAALQNILSAKQTFAGVRAPVAPDAPGNSLLRGARIIGVTRTSAQIPRIVGDCLTAYLRALRGANQVMTRGTNTTESGVFAFTSRGSAAKKANALFSRILSRCLGGTCRNSNWTGSRQTETTNPETCGSFLEAKTWRTGDKSQKCSSASPILKPVYDITNAGPNRRFTVLTDGGPVIVHNCELALGFQGGKGAFQAMARGYGVKVSDEQADEIKLAWRAANPEVVGFWRGLNSAAIECMRRPIGEQVDVWTLDSEWKPWHRTPLFFKRSRAALGLRLPSGRSICYWTPQLRDVDTPWGRRPAVLYYSEDSVTKQWRQFTAYGGILCENCLTGDTIAITQHGGKRLDSITAGDLVWDGVEWVRHGGVISKGVQRVVEFAGVRITPEHKVLTGAGMVANQDTTPAEAWRAFSEHYRLPAVYACGRIISRVQPGPARGLALPMRLRAPQRHDIAGFLARVGALLRVFDRRNEVRGDARTDRKTRHVAASGVRGLAVHAIPVPQPKPQGVRQLRRAWHTGLRCLANVRGFLAGYGTFLRVRTIPGPDEQQRRVLPGQLSVDFDARAIAQHSAERVPGNTVGAHNGVAGGGLGRHKPDDALLSHGKQVAGGQDVREAEQRAPGDCAEVFDIINAGPRHRFTVIGADGRPFIVSNCVQATARDVMAFAWRNARSAGMRPFLSVHDELICLLPKTREAAGGGNHPFYPTAEEAAQAVESIMRQAPPWARGLPIAADSSAGPRYVKA